MDQYAGDSWQCDRSSNRRDANATRRRDIKEMAISECSIMGSCIKLHYNVIITPTFHFVRLSSPKLNRHLLASVLPLIS